LELPRGQVRTVIWVQSTAVLSLSSLMIENAKIWIALRHVPSPCEKPTLAYCGFPCGREHSHFLCNGLLDCW